MDYNLSRYEKETVVTFNEEESFAELYTCSQTVMRKMDALVAEYPVFTLKNEDEISKTYIFPKRYFKVRKPSWREGKKPSFFETGGKEDEQNMADP